MVPSSHVALLDGIPLNGLTEVVLFCVLLICTLFLKAHRTIFDLLSDHRALRRGLLAILIVVIPLRLVLFAATDDSGVFRGCYRPANEWSHSGDCEASYENFGRTSATRFDSVIDFGERSEPLTGVITNTNWNLGFVNDLRFNVYPWEEGNPDLIRFPFSANWGRISSPPMRIASSASPTSAKVLSLSARSL